MYESPVTIYETAMETIIERRENAIFAKVQDAFDVQVDKKEMIRALRYDRDQYEKGYADGKAAAAPEWISVKDRLPEAGTKALCYLKRGEYWTAVWDDCGDDLWSDGEAWCSNGEVTHWMPLPEPPEVK